MSIFFLVLSGKTKYLIPAFAVMITAVLVFGTASPVMAGSWVISIGEKSGSLEITEEDTKFKLKQKAKSLDELDLSDYKDITKTRLGKAINDDGQYFLVWKLMSVEHDEESDTTIKTIYVLDAGTGEPLLDEPIKKEGGSCGYKDKSKISETSGEQA